MLTYSQTSKDAVSYLRTEVTLPGGLIQEQKSSLWSPFCKQEIILAFSSNHVYQKKEKKI